RSFPVQVRASGERRSHVANLLAVTPAYAEARALNGLLDHGKDRFLTDLDEERLARVAVLGAKVVEQLFPDDDPVGKTLLLSSRAFQIVGVFRPQPQNDAIDHDNDVYIPLGTCHRVFGETTVLREPGSFRAERVAVSDAVVTLRNASQV